MKQRFCAFSLVELLVVISIVSCLATLSIPALSGMLAMAQTSKCANNMRQLGTAVLLYAMDHQMILPDTSHQEGVGGFSWTNSLQPYAEGQVTFKCPSDENKVRSRTYVMNDFLTRSPCEAPYLDFSHRLSVQRPQDTILYAEANSSAYIPDHFHFSAYHGYEMPSEDFAALVGVTRHRGKANYVFADAHVETLSWPEVQVRLAQPGSRFIDPTR